MSLYSDRVSRPADEHFGSINTCERKLRWRRRELPGRRAGVGYDPQADWPPWDQNCSAVTRSADASGRSGVRAASVAATRADRVCSRDWAICDSACQNSASRATLVRCPAREKLRLIRPLRLRLHVDGRTIAFRNAYGYRLHAFVLMRGFRGKRIVAAGRRAAVATFPLPESDASRLIGGTAALLGARST
jgi:hypothetical protein